jgi:hypothetical protein
MNQGALLHIFGFVSQHSFQVIQEAALSLVKPTNLAVDLNLQSFV